MSDDRFTWKPGDLLPGRWAVPDAEALARGERPVPLDDAAMDFARSVGWPWGTGDRTKDVVVREES